ncbi:MAG: lipocalin family protein [Bacteroidetes bacterium]|nr:lipocalin family protein [Bacteroidota bacterium]
MKNTLNLIFVSLLLLFLSCRDKDEPTTGKTIQGTWKLTEAKISNGGSANWEAVANGYTLKLKSDNTYETTQLPSCNTGTYSIDANNVIKFTNSCGNTSIPNSFKIISIENNFFIWNGTFCIEECQEKFTRIE